MQVNPQGKKIGKRRVNRGFGWEEDDSGCGVSYRDRELPFISGDYIGFRLVFFVKIEDLKDVIIKGADRCK